MLPNINQLEDKEDIFDITIGFYDTPKKLNRSNVNISQDFIEQIENHEVTSEMVSELAKQVPIFKYKTCLTIHGNFDFESIPRIGGYKSVRQNQNGSLEINWIAIDYAKKMQIYEYLLHFKAKFNFHTTSQSNSFFRMFRYDENTDEETFENELQALIDIKDKLNAVKGFNGKARVGKGNYWGVSYIFISVLMFSVTSEAVSKIVQAMANVNDLQVKQAENEMAEKDRLEQIESEKRELERIENNRIFENKKLELQTAISSLHPFRFEKGLMGVNVTSALNKHHQMIPCYKFIRLTDKSAFGKWKFESYVSSSLELDTSKFKPFPKAVSKEILSGYKLFSVKTGVTIPLQENTLKTATMAQKTVSNKALEVVENEKLKGIELRFAEKPSDEVLESLKEVGFAYSFKQKMWYAKANFDTRRFAEILQEKLNN